MRMLANIFWLGTKELRSLRRDTFMLVFIIYTFSLGTYIEATGVSQELHNAAVGIVDEDRSDLSRRIRQALLPPWFSAPQQITLADVDRGMDGGRYTFVLDIPPNFQADVIAGMKPAIQVNIDATAMMQAGIGEGYLTNIINQEVAEFQRLRSGKKEQPIELRARFVFNSNLNSMWFTGTMSIINHITLLACLASGAALVREREHGTIDHLLVMPLRPVEIMMAKVWANSLVILVAVTLSLVVVLGWILHVPFAGSVPLYLSATAIYLMFASSLGILLGTIARSMPQLGLLFILVAVPMMLLSGAETPIESMPEAFQIAMQGVASTHYVAVTKAILFRGAGLDVVWPQLITMAGMAAILFAIALSRFRKMLAQS